MSQRDSGHKRIKLDAYETPTWVTDAVAPHLPIVKGMVIWEPAAGSGKMVRALRKHDHPVKSSDIARGNKDFLKTKQNVEVIVTNPPYSHAQKFIEHALASTEYYKGVVAMLLNLDYDSANGRRYLFADNACFTKKVVLTKRIRWIENSTGSPSANHAWYIWDWANEGPPTIAYGP